MATGCRLSWQGAGVLDGEGRPILGFEDQMSGLSQMDISLDGIGHLLSDKRLDVPRYQRPYAWTEKHIRDLYLDLSDAKDRGETEYFLGSVVTIGRGTERLEVVDGQQRLATISILLAAIRDYFYTNGDQERAMGMEREYLMRRDLGTLEVVPHLQLSEIDNEYFRRRVLSRPDDPNRSVPAPHRESIKRIDIAANLAREHIELIAQSGTDPTQRLVSWATYIRDNAQIILVRVRDDANAFTIFETLNDRGLALAITDLIKNMLFSRSRARIDEVQQRWIAMTGILESLEDEDIVLDFIRHYWFSRQGVTRKDDLFKSIKDNVNGVQPVIDFADNLQRNAPLYEAIVSPDGSAWDQYSERAQEDMRTLNLLGMVQIRPLLLAVLDEFDPQEVNKAMRSAVSWSVRFLTVGGLGGGSLESQYSQRALDVRHGRIKTARELIEAMRKVVPTNSQFRNAFGAASITKAAVARYYLRVLEGVAMGNSNPPLIVSTNTKAVNLEHVLPQNPSKEWRNIDADLARTYFNRIGNLAILETRMNKDLQNSGFATKSPIYKKSAIMLTSEIGIQSDWGVTEIENRQRRLAELAVAAWSI